MVLLRVAMRVLSVVSQLIMVRLLTPADFGLAAASAAVVAILDGLTETSMGLALVQMRAPQRHHYNAAWTLIVARGLVVGAALWAVAPAMADFMRDERIADVIRVLSIMPVVQGFESIGMIRLQRELNFRRVFIYQLGSKTVGFLVALPLVFIYHNYWALVLGGVVARVVMVPLSYVIAPARPGLSLRGIGEMFNFSKLLLLTNVLTMADASLMTMTLGRLGTLREVGLYQVSNELASLPASEIAAPIRGPMYAGLARVAEDARLLRYQLLSGLGFLVMIIVPMSAGIAVTAPWVVHVALGPQWVDATPVLALATVCALFDAIGHASGAAYLVRHAQAPYVRIMAGCLALRLALVLPAAMLGGLVWAVGMMALTAIVAAFLWYHRLRRWIGVSWGDLLRPVWRSFTAAAVMVAALLLVQLLWPRMSQPLAMALQWAALCALGATIHIGTQILLWRWSAAADGPEAQLLRKLVPRLQALTARLSRG